MAACGGDSLGSGGRQAAGFSCHCAAAAKDHVDVDHDDDFVGDVELDEDLDVVVQLNVNVRLGVVSGSKQCRRLDVDRLDVGVDVLLCSRSSDML